MDTCTFSRGPSMRPAAEYFTSGWGNSRGMGPTAQMTSSQAQYVSNLHKGTRLGSDKSRHFGGIRMNIILSLSGGDQFISLQVYAS